MLVFLNRRGYAPTLLCTACGWIAPCRDCDARLTVHLAAGRLRCHHCGADEPLPARCPQCGFAVKPVGQGTERIAEALAPSFRRRWSRASTATSCAGAATSRASMQRMSSRRGAHPRRHADGHQGTRLPEHDAGGGAECGPGPVQHRLPRARAPRADHRAGRGARRARSKTRRGADPDGIPRSPAAAEPARGRVRRLRARGAGGAPQAPPGRRSAGSRRCALRPAAADAALAFLSEARAPGAPPARRRATARSGARGDGEARRALSRAAAAGEPGACAPARLPRRLAA